MLQAVHLIHLTGYLFFHQIIDEISPTHLPVKKEHIQNPQYLSKGSLQYDPLSSQAREPALHQTSSPAVRAKL